MGTMSNNLFFAIQLAEYEEKLEREKEAYEKALKKGKNNNFYFAINSKVKGYNHYARSYTFDSCKDSPNKEHFKKTKASNLIDEGYNVFITNDSDVPVNFEYFYTVRVRRMKDLLKGEIFKLTPNSAIEYVRDSFIKGKVGSFRGVLSNANNYREDIFSYLPYTPEDEIMVESTTLVFTEDVGCFCNTTSRACRY